ncbi:MAG: bifunctional folylpolyglutamate synthase/dihydrofolate synthase, partial [bacterium]
MTRNDTLKFLTNLQRFGWRLGLENISTLLAKMGNPQFRFKCIHIGGTNGKGSTAALLESMFRQAGYKTGLFTSPHLLTVSERIKVNGHPIAIEKLVSYVERLKDAIQTIGCTYFEALTAVAFQYFADVGVNLAFIEVGLGGRFDATNVITPVLSIITNIDLEHSEHLGWTKSKIAEEKAGIIKSEVPCLSGSKNQAVNAVLEKNAEQKHASFHKLADMCAIYPQKLTENFSEFNLIFSRNHYNQLKVGLVGRHQVQNVALAVAAVEILAQQDFMI